MQKIKYTAIKNPPATAGGNVEKGHLHILLWECEMLSFFNENILIV